jgi:hypothetical protein
MMNTSDINSMEEEEEDVEVECVTHCDINITCHRIGATRDKLNLNKYSVAKSPPHHNLTIEKLTEKFGTTIFLSALTTFLHNNLPGTSITPNIRDRFDAYKQLVITLPINRFLGERIVMDRVQTSPFVNASGRVLSKAAHFDTAFIVEDLGLYNLEGGISGIFFLFFRYFHLI